MRRTRIILSVAAVVGLGLLGWWATGPLAQPEPPAADIRVRHDEATRMSTGSYCWKSRLAGGCVDTFGFTCRGEHRAATFAADQGDLLRFRLGFEPVDAPVLHASRVDARGEPERRSDAESKLKRSRHPSWKLSLKPPLLVEVFVRAKAGSASYAICVE